jgi:hypothetical protein
VVRDRDEDLAAAWLANERLYHDREPDDHSVPAGYDFEVDAQVGQLVFGAADANRAAQLIEAMLAAARDEQDLKDIGIGPLENLLRDHGETLAPWVGTKANSYPRFRFALASCWPFESIAPIVDELTLHKGRTHGYWTTGLRLRCQVALTGGELLDAKLQPDVIGGESVWEDPDYLVYFDYWARDHSDATSVSKRLERALLARLEPSDCAVTSTVGPEQTWPPGARPGIDRPRRSRL